jgi:molybdopterin molybdotransferase
MPGQPGARRQAERNGPAEQKPGQRPETEEPRGTASSVESLRKPVAGAVDRQWPGNLFGPEDDVKGGSAADTRDKPRGTVESSAKDTVGDIDGVEEALALLRPLPVAEPAGSAGAAASSAPSSSTPRGHRAEAGAVITSASRAEFPDGPGAVAGSPTATGGGNRAASGRGVNDDGSGSDNDHGGGNYGEKAGENADGGGAARRAAAADGVTGARGVHGAGPAGPAGGGSDGGEADGEADGGGGGRGRGTTVGARGAGSRSPAIGDREVGGSTGLPLGSSGEGPVQSAGGARREVLGDMADGDGERKGPFTVPGGRAVSGVVPAVDPGHERPAVGRAGRGGSDRGGSGRQGRDMRGPGADPGHPDGGSPARPRPQGRPDAEGGRPGAGAVDGPLRPVGPEGPAGTGRPEYPGEQVSAVAPEAAARRSGPGRRAVTPAGESVPNPVPDPGTDPSPGAGTDRRSTGAPAARPDTGPYAGPGHAPGSGARTGAGKETGRSARVVGGPAAAAGQHRPSAEPERTAGTGHGVGEQPSAPYPPTAHRPATPSPAVRHGAGPGRTDGPLPSSPSAMDRAEAGSPGRGKRRPSEGAPGRFVPRGPAGAAAESAGAPAAARRTDANPPAAGPRPASPSAMDRAEAGSPGQGKCRPSGGAPGESVTGALGGAAAQSAGASAGARRADAEHPVAGARAGRRPTRHTAMAWHEARAAAAAAGAGRVSAVRAVELEQCAGRLLAEPLTALCDLPSFDTSAMDGWAVAGPGPWTVVDVTPVLAGYGDAAPLADGTAVRIATGAPVPPGTTGVVRSEHAVVDPARGTLQARPPLSPGQDIRPRGQECRTGDRLLPAGVPVTPAVVGLASAAGYDRLPVTAGPLVEVLVLGDELLTEGLPYGGRIRDAIGPMLVPWLTALGADVLGVRRLGDDAEALSRAVAGSSADVVLTTGGTAAGPVDHLHPVLRAAGAELLVDGVAVRPGHPMLLARLPRRQGSAGHPGAPGYLVGLPGNPLAAVAGLLTLAEPLLRSLAGAHAEPLRRVPLAREVPGHPYDTRLVPCGIRDGRVLEPLRFGGPAMLRGVAAADGVAVIAPGGAGPGEEVALLEFPWSGGRKG